MSKTRKIFAATLATLILALGASAPAMAQSSVQGYSDEGGAIQQDIGGVAPATQSADTGAAGTSGSSGLPFTGLDVALLFGAGAVLAAAGLGMRRFARPREVA
jgi:hypothetical protein